MFSSTSVDVFVLPMLAVASAFHYAFMLETSGYVSALCSVLHLETARPMRRSSLAVWE